MTRLARRLIVLVLSLLLLVPACVPARGEETLQLEGRFWGWDKTTPRSWLFPYSDSYFSGDASVYNHSLARCSLGLALSAFRNTHQELEQKADNIVSYLTQAGFEHICLEDYDKPTSQDTIGTAIASKDMGSYTLVACAVSGGGYGNEWKSNFLVGDETRSLGFNQASQKVQSRIRDYVSGLTGEVRLWISGYSRAAAVSNLTAADMTDSGLFTQVFAYTFATPNVTREKGDYSNIFNIIGKTDPVPCVPLRDWGYQHYGIDLYTPAQEYDWDYAIRAEKANQIALELTGSPFHNNPIMNNALHRVLDYLLAAYPDSASYHASLEGVLIDLWGADREHLTDVFLEAIQTAEAMPQATIVQFTELVNYVQEQVAEQLRTRDSQAAAGLWNTDSTLSENVAREHTPELYVEWMFSTDHPEELFSTEQDSFLRFTLSGDCTVSIYDIYGFVQEISGDGTVTTSAGNSFSLRQSNPIELFSVYDEGTLVLTLPADHEWLISVHSNREQTVSYVAARFSLGSLRSTPGALHTCALESGEEMYLLVDENLLLTTQEGEEEFRDLPDNTDYSPSALIHLEKMNSVQFDLMDLVLILSFALGLLLILALAEGVLALIRRARHKKRRTWVSMVTHTLLTLFTFVLAQFYAYTLNALPTVGLAFSGLTLLFLLLLTLAAARRTRCRLGYLQLLGIALLGGAGLLQLQPWSSLLLLSGLGTMGTAFLLEKQWKKQDFLIALGIFALISAALVLTRDSVGSLFLPFLGAALLLSLVLTLSLRFHPMTFAAWLLYTLTLGLLAYTMLPAAPSGLRSDATCLHLLALVFLGWNTGRKKKQNA